MARTPLRIVIPRQGAADDKLCPVLALENYIRVFPSTARKLFINPQTGCPLTASTLALWLCKAMDWLLPSAISKAHDMREAAHSLAWVKGTPISDFIKKALEYPNVFVK